MNVGHATVTTRFETPLYHSDITPPLWRARPSLPPPPRHEAIGDISHRTAHCCVAPFYRCKQQVATLQITPPRRGAVNVWVGGRSRWYSWKWAGCLSCGYPTCKTPFQCDLLDIVPFQLRSRHCHLHSGKKCSRLHWTMICDLWKPLKIVSGIQQRFKENHEG